MKVKVNFVGYESVQSESGIGGNNNRWDYAQSFGETKHPNRNPNPN